MREVVARVDALFRRLELDRGVARTVRIGAAEIDFQAMTVRRDGAEAVPLPEKEAGILRYLLENPDRVVTRDELLLHVWKYPVAGIETRTVDNYIVRLRGRVEPDRSSPTVILTVRGRGYRLGERPA